MARQTARVDQWIVVDDGVMPAPLTMGQTHIRRKRTAEGGASLALNIIEAVRHLTADLVVIIEDDDYYRANHLEVCRRRLATHEAVGCIWLNYYNVELRAWRRIRNSCAALCNTALRASALPMLRAAAEAAIAAGVYHVDRLFWQRVGAAGLHQEETVIGIKGLPGRRGIGIGHRKDGAWRADPDGVKAREWLGVDAAWYAPEPVTGKESNHGQDRTDGHGGIVAGGLRGPSMGEAGGDIATI